MYLASAKSCQTAVKRREHQLRLNTKQTNDNKAKVMHSYELTDTALPEQFYPFLLTVVIATNDFITATH
jgi:hypothetical protein